MEVMTTDYAATRIRELEEMCSVRPSTLALADLASCYFTMGYPERALPLAQHAWKMDRATPGLGMNLAMTYKDLGRHVESLQVLEIAFANAPDDFYIRLGYAEALLRAGFWKQAWLVYDNSRPTQNGAALDIKLPSSVREWDGQPLPDGHELIVINEGGTGDRLSYARWLPKLTEMGINWRFYPYSELFPFFERILPRERLIADSEDANPTHWVTAFSLPAKLNCGPNEIPPPMSFVATPESIAKYPIARTDDKPIIGLCYAAAELFQGGRKVRSITEGQALRLVCMTGDLVHWVSLQHGAKMPFPVTTVPFVNWEDTAGFITNLDAVVSVDTAVAHLAGSLNKPLAIVLGGNSCWKWCGSKKKHPLYPSATLYRTLGQGFEDSINTLVSDIRSGAWPGGV